jgi:cytochrome c biogenesis protein CcmG/thiol:disulfide interchange protein DsbE
MMFVSLGIGTLMAVALIVVVSVLTGGKVTTQNGDPVSALVGTRVAGFTLGGLNGGTERAPWAKGHAGVLIFFASWCAPCRGEIPKVATYLRTHDTGTVTVLGVDSNDGRTAAQAFVKRGGVGFPVAFDANGTVTSSVFSFGQLPETVFVTAAGVVTDVHFGAISVAQLASGIKSLQAGA